ncbi:MAG: hypothetical protein AMXMBFR4_04270 [Candidatus Hydrogenedentota bacterium]
MPEVKPEGAEQPAPIPEVQQQATIPPSPPDAATAQATFERVFGDAARLDPAMRENVLADEHGKRHYVDNSLDGRPDEVWYVDLDLRHADSMRPVLVRAIDQDADLVEGKEPDLDSDVYVADWNADGTVDAILDYTDIDDDQDVDEIALYVAGGPLANGDPNILTAWWARDVGDDNLLLYDVGFAFDLPRCQWRSHFGGNERFAAFVLEPGAAEWRLIPESQYIFADHDGDHVSEEAIRIGADGAALFTLQHSFDADNDADVEQQRDYDVSITARATQGGIPTPESDAERAAVMGIATGRMLTFDAAQRAAGLAWDRVLLTWDENDHNVDGETFADTNERWEGVIAMGTEGFDAIGSPHVGAFNKRYELAIRPGKPMELYYHPADQRVHLKYAQRAWIDVDVNLDRSADMKYQFLDSDNDGIVDTWNVDVNADNVVDDTWTASPAAVKPVAWTWQDMNAIQKEVLKSAPAALFGLARRLEEAVTAKGADPTAGNATAAVVRSNFTALDTAIARKFISSDETGFYYLGILKDSWIAQLKSLHENAEFWQVFYEARGQGDYARMQGLLETEFGLAAEVPVYADWIAQQRDALLGYPRVNALVDWIPDSIGWESELESYRGYWGQIDYFGKRERRFVLADAAIGDPNQDAPWGMDALHVRDTCGIGGVTLYVNDNPYAVRSPGGKGIVTFEKSIVEQTPDHATVEMKASNVGPQGNTFTVRMRMTAFAGRRDSAVEIVVDGGTPDDRVELGVGLTKLAHQTVSFDQQAGIVAVFGEQSRTSGRIGLGLIYPPERFLREGELPGEHQVVLTIERGIPLVYFIQATWQRGRPYPVAPTAENWLEELRATAARNQAQ